MAESNVRLRKRRWLSLSLRTVLLAVTVFAIWLAWLVPRAQQQKKVADWIREYGRAPYYTYQFDANGKYSMNLEPPGPKWIRNTVGIDYFSSIRMIHLDNKPLRDISMISSLAHLQHCEMSDCEITDLSPIAKLHKLELLSVSHNPITDLSPISELKYLKHLSIFDTKITDISPVKNLRNLESLYLINNANTDLSPLSNHPALVTIDISSSGIDNIEPLKSIQTLKSLNLSGTRVPESQILELESALPNCSVTR